MLVVPVVQPLRLGHIIQDRILIRITSIFRALSVDLMAPNTEPGESGII
jgi:hypothetical protein